MRIEQFSSYLCIRLFTVLCCDVTGWECVTLAFLPISHCRSFDLMVYRLGVEKCAKQLRLFQRRLKYCDSALNDLPLIQCWINTDAGIHPASTNQVQVVRVWKLRPEASLVHGAPECNTTPASLSKYAVEKEYVQMSIVERTSCIIGKTASDIFATADYAGRANNIRPNTTRR